MSNDIDTCDPQAWISRGRDPETANAIAAAWRAFPDLPNDASLEDRMSRIRARATALKPIFKSFSIKTEEARKANNFRFTEGKIANGTANQHEKAIITARNLHQLDWNEAVRYADGWF